MTCTRLVTHDENGNQETRRCVITGPHVEHQDAEGWVWTNWPAAEDEDGDYVTYRAAAE